MPPLPHQPAKAPTPPRAELGKSEPSTTPCAEPDPASRDADAQSRRFAEELQRAKLEAMKELAYGASHEINNPLANIALRAQSLLKREDDAEKQKMLRAIHRQAMRAHEMISDLMLFARPPALSRETTPIAPLVERVVGEVEPLAEESGVRITWCDPDQAVAWIDPMQVAVALRAVVENAIESIDGGGRVSIEARAPDPARVTIAVVDDGPGAPEEILPHLFDPFFSGREAGRGLGFGLSKCWRIVTDHGGEVCFENRSPTGACVTLSLPSRDGSRG